MRCPWPTIPPFAAAVIYRAGDEALPHDAVAGGATDVERQREQPEGGAGQVAAHHHAGRFRLRRSSVSVVDRGAGGVQRPPERPRDEPVFEATAALTSSLKAAGSTSSSAPMSIARRVPALRLALKSPCGSGSDAPLAKVSLTLSL